MSASRTTALTIAVAAILIATPALSDGGPRQCPSPASVNSFMQIHLDNQKIGSEVSLYWRLQTAAWRLASEAG